MNALSKEEKMKLIIELAEKHDITAYEFGNNTEISTFAADRLLSGKTGNPSRKTVNEMLFYIENKIVGTKVGVEEKPEIYKAKGKSVEDVYNSIERLTELVTKNNRVFSKALEATLLNTEEILVHTETIEDHIKNNIDSLNSLESVVEKSLRRNS
ncbi:hypothetical protein [Mesonia aquimarina]|uniref:hypothetical protein n=1 Tax=Mesonia aquimarina TaxID=1504967 RepID=UPI000EF5DD3A|nr:hypothetical protein [Mesonia aquimarina]